MEDEKLPECNPKRVCPACGEAFPTWKLFFNSQEKRLCVGNSFCPTSDGKGGAIEVCGECKTTGLEASKAKKLRELRNQAAV